jgi:hypothetical protein
MRHGVDVNHCPVGNPKRKVFDGILCRARTIFVWFSIEKEKKDKESDVYMYAQALHELLIPVSLIN